MRRGTARRPLNPIIIAISLMNLATLVPKPIALAGPQGVSGKWRFTGDLNTARAGHIAILLPDGKVLVVGGGDARAELYDPSTGTWSFTASPKGGGCATLLPTGKVLIVGVGSAELYDPSTGTLTATGSMTEQASCSTATLLTNGKVLITGTMGKSANGYPVATPELYDPSTGTFTSTGRFVGQGVEAVDLGLLEAPAILLQNGEVLFVANPTGQLYDPVSGTFSLTSAMITQVTDFPRTATLLRNGKVLVTGGETDWGRLRNAELYDPSTGTFTATGDMTTGRVFHTATLLPDGRVLITGGETDACAVGGCSFAGSTASAEIFDPSTGTFSSAADMAARRELHTATLLNDGRVLVAGGLWYAGIGGFMGMLASAELFDPNAPTPVPAPSIISASVEGKKLIVVGENFDSGAVILINGEEQATKNDGQNPQTTLIAKKAGRKIKPGDKIQVRNSTGALSPEFTFAGAELYSSRYPLQLSGQICSLGRPAMRARPTRFCVGLSPCSLDKVKMAAHQSAPLIYQSHLLRPVRQAFPLSFVRS